jgi:hypothetical protein
MKAESRVLICERRRLRSPDGLRRDLSLKCHGNGITFGAVNVAAYPTMSQSLVVQYRRR